MERALSRDFPIFTGEIVVAAVERPAPRLARITFEGLDLDRLPDDQPGECLTLIWPAPGKAEALLPEEGWRFPPGAGEQHARNFTIRSYEPGHGAVVVDFVLHGDHGRASAWATRAKPGHRLWFAGPRAHYFDDPSCDWTLLAGDETALPSIAATLERAPDEQRILAFVEADPEAADRVELPAPANGSVTWIEREERPGHCSSALLRALREAELPPGEGKVWVAGEAGVVRGIRTYLRDGRGLTIGPRQAVGYWKHRDTPADVEEDVE